MERSAKESECEVDFGKARLAQFEPNLNCSLRVSFVLEGILFLFVNDEASKASINPFDF